LNDIVADKGKPATSMALSASTTRQDSAAYVAGYDAAGWTGSVVAYKVNAGTGSVETTGLWGTEPAVPATATTPAIPAHPTSTASIMDRTGFAPASRLVLSNQTTGAVSSGIAWTWANLDDSKKILLNTLDGTLDALGEARLAYLRGDRSQEGSPFRVRGSRHGDIVNSKVWRMPGYYLGSKTGSTTRPSMLYVGANDGMLHGFDAANGQEKVAYVPEGLHAHLAELTRPGYLHRYYVDGSPFTADVNIGGWKSYLAGFPGAGGKGYFILDVTNPATFSGTAPSGLVVLDNTATSDADVGHILNAPVTEQTNEKIATQITRMNDGRWALVTGNGYNSSSEKAVLLVQYLDGNKELRKIVADSAGGNGNGLSAPRLIDLNGDGTADIAYAGDLKGKLWKFNLSSATASEWNVAFGGTPLFSAATSQAITTAPAWMFHPDGGLMLMFGTGRSLTDSDRVDLSQQAIYGIRDATSFKLAGALVSLGTENNAVTGIGDLVAQTIGNATSGTATTGNQLFTLSSNTVNFTGANAKKGWYLNFPRAKERSI
ncbi:MAG: pilus assembly protein PilY, partial [Alcaligenaceae bacterium]